MHEIKGLLPSNQIVGFFFPSSWEIGQVRY